MLSDIVLRVLCVCCACVVQLNYHGCCKYPVCAKDDCPLITKSTQKVPKSTKKYILLFCIIFKYVSTRNARSLHSVSQRTQCSSLARGSHPWRHRLCARLWYACCKRRFGHTLTCSYAADLGYRAIVYKTYYTMEWAVEHVNARFILKVKTRLKPAST